LLGAAADAAAGVAAAGAAGTPVKPESFAVSFTRCVTNWRMTVRIASLAFAACVALVGVAVLPSVVISMCWAVLVIVAAPVGANIIGAGFVIVSNSGAVQTEC